MPTRVLMIDDEEGVNDGYVEQLNLKRFEADAWYEKDAGLVLAQVEALVRTWNPQVIVLDWRWDPEKPSASGCTGAKVFRLLHDAALLRDRRVIYLTQYRDHIRKPIEELQELAGDEFPTIEVVWRHTMNAIKFADWLAGVCPP